MRLYRHLAGVLAMLALLASGATAAEVCNTSVFSQTDGSNNTGTMPSWLGSAAPSTIDDAGRALQGAITREWNWRGFTLTAGGTADAKTLTYSVAPAAYCTGQIYSFIANTTNTGSATINVNSLGAKTIKKDVSGTMTALAASDMPSGTRVMLAYDGTDMIWVNWQGSATSYTVNGQTEETAPDVADMLGGYDTSAAAERKFSITNVYKTINGLTTDSSPDQAADYVPTYDASASGGKKVLLNKIGVGVKSIALLAGSGTLPSGGGIATCTSVSAFDSGSNDVFLRQCSFSASADNAIYWTIPAPKSSDETVDWTLRIDWTSATTTDATDDVIWTASAVCFSNDDAINGNAFPAVDTVTDTQTAAGDFLSSSSITAITPAGTWAENDMCVLRVTRDADAAGDNFNGTAELINAQLFITTTVNQDN